MTDTPHKYAPVSTYLMVDNGAEALNFYRRHSVPRSSKPTPMRKNSDTLP